MNFSPTNCVHAKIIASMEHRSPRHMIYPSKGIHSVWALKHSDGASLYANPPDAVRCHNPTPSSHVRFAESTESVTPLQHTPKATISPARFRSVRAPAATPSLMQLAAPPQVVLQPSNANESFAGPCMPDKTDTCPGMSERVHRIVQLQERADEAHGCATATTAGGS